MVQINAMRLKRKLRNGLANGLNHGKPWRADNQNGIYENAAPPPILHDGERPLLYNPATREAHCNGLQPPGPVQSDVNPSELHNVPNERNADVEANPVGHSATGLIERTAQNDIKGNQTIGDDDDGTASSGRDRAPKREVGPVVRRPSFGMINDDRFLPGASKSPVGGPANSSGDDFVTDGQRSGEHSIDHSAGSDPLEASKMSRSSSIRREEESYGAHRREAAARELFSAQPLATCRDSNDNLVPISLAEQSELDNGERLDSSEGKLPRELVVTARNATELGSNREGKQLAGPKQSDTEKLSDELQMPSSTEVGEPPRRLRPAASLMRRDESWHSMLSLNQLEANQDALRADPDSRGLPRVHIERFPKHSSIRKHIESTVTPLRERPFVRQQSMQMNRNRALPPMVDHPQANSFDGNHIQHSAPIQNDSEPAQPPPPPISYHQKLVQLQLMHNSNADYAQNRNDHQIYGPGSIATTNHYGYYSMRSNLRSAASEFSFIRPGSSNPNPSLPQAAPPQLGQLAAVNINHFRDIPMHQAQLDPSSRPLAIPVLEWKLLMQNSNTTDSMDHMKPPNGFADSIAPDRRLPLKPNKKRVPAGRDNQKGPSPAIGSGIVQFFKRAFSRRSRQRPKLAESCSSSLGVPFDESFESMQRARSAFSTTEGNRSSSRDQLLEHRQQTTAANQQHRMIDLIEAFANRTTLDRGTYDNLPRQSNVGHQPSQFASPFRSSVRNEVIRPPQLVHYQQKPSNRLQQQVMNSPLHKSSSISASTGLSGLNEMMRLNEHHKLVRESMSPGLAPVAGPRSSPLIRRSTKVMSVNLTPVSSRREAGARDLVGGYFEKQPPRPSSIYGQPSMISSPMSINSHELSQNDFASRRANFPQRTEHMSPSSVNLDMRRYHHQMKMPSLDTTREVAEETSTPTSEYKPFPSTRIGDNTNEMSPVGHSTPQQRQRPSRIVNPILQSPTMNFIYDNHPVPRTRNGLRSHYDNPGTLRNQQSMSSTDLNGHTSERQQEDRMGAEQEHQQRQSLYYCADVISPKARDYNSRQRHADGTRNRVDHLATPSHCNMRLSHQSMKADANYKDPDRPMATYTRPSNRYLIQ